MTPDDRLAAFLSEDAGPPRASVDAVFVAEVMHGVVRRELNVGLATAGVTALSAAAVLWACAPVLNLAIHALAPTLAPVAGVVAFVLAGTLLGGQMLARR